MTFGLHLIQNPSGTWSFVGSVPWALCYEAKAGGTPLTYADMADQLRLPPQFRSMRTRAWETRDAALAEAREAGIELETP